MHMAVEQGSAKLVTLMLEKGPIDVNSPVSLYYYRDVRVAVNHGCS